jgi:hypothetical protein
MMTPQEEAIRAGLHPHVMIAKMVCREVKRWLDYEHRDAKPSAQMAERIANLEDRIGTMELGR